MLVLFGMRYFCGTLRSSLRNQSLKSTVAVLESFSGLATTLEVSITANNRIGAAIDSLALIFIAAECGSK